MKLNRLHACMYCRLNLKAYASDRVPSYRTLRIFLIRQQCLCCVLVTPNRRTTSQPINTHFVCVKWNILWRAQYAFYQINFSDMVLCAYCAAYELFIGTDRQWCCACCALKRNRLIETFHSQYTAVCL